MTRAEKVARAQALRAEGLTFREIGERMGAAIQTVDSWLNDPDGSRLAARKASYRGTCVDCGAPTNGNDGRAKAAARCVPCAARAQTIWTPETVVAAMRRFHDRYGRAPVMTDFNTALACRLGHPEKAERFYADGDYPTTPSVQRVFGTWNAAITAAGFEPLAIGHKLSERRVAA